MLTTQFLLIILNDSTVKRRFIKISYMYGLAFAPVPDNYIELLKKINL